MFLKRRHVQGHCSVEIRSHGRLLVVAALLRVLMLLVGWVAGRTSTIAMVTTVHVADETRAAANQLSVITRLCYF